MARPKAPEKAVLFMGLLYSDEEIYRIVRGRLETEFGGTFHESGSLHWSHTDYYKDELGEDISRRFLFFAGTIDPVCLPDIKLKTNAIEDDYTVSERRRINIDPGYMTLAKIVLATAKNYSHRIYLRNGIYAEATLVYIEGGFRPHLFTYADYNSDKVIETFHAARKAARSADYI